MPFAVSAKGMIDSILIYESGYHEVHGQEIIKKISSSLLAKK